MSGDAFVATFSDRQSHLSVVIVMEPKGINDQLKLVVLRPGLEGSPRIGELRVNQASREEIQEYRVCLVTCGHLFN